MKIPNQKHDLQDSKVRARLEAGKFCSESESSEMISVYQESISGAAVWLANGRI